MYSLQTQLDFLSEVLSLEPPYWHGTEDQGFWCCPTCWLAQEDEVGFIFGLFT